MEDLLCQLMRYCVMQTKNGNHLSFQYAGHVHGVFIGGRKGPWVAGEKDRITYNIFLDQQPFNQEVVDDIIKDINEKLA